jgi:hypothetical protein
MKMRTVVPALILTSLFSCMWVAWIGYEHPTESDFHQVQTTPNCMAIGVQNLKDPRQRTAVLEAVGEVCLIFASAEFAREVASRTWLASCKRPNGGPDEISGEEVYRRLGGELPDYSVHPRDPWDAIAQADPHDDRMYNRVAISPSQIGKWYSRSRDTRGDLVNTIAHETTHIVSTGFQDEGHAENCDSDRLVSYGIGKLTEDLWEARPTD